jgi:Rrf2 family protein
MLITRAGEYAILSLFTLSKAHKPLDTQALANELKIPKSFLAKILQNLARANILRSYKGVNGGFSLEIDTKNITILSILVAVEPKNPSVFECSNNETDCPSDQAKDCSIWPFFNNLQNHINIFLEQLTLNDILNGKK